MELLKDEAFEILFERKFTILLGWNNCIKRFRKRFMDLDLCAFYRKKNGETGGVFSSEFNLSKKHTEGSLSEFPFIFLFGENRLSPKYENEEMIGVVNIHKMEEVFIVAVDYNAAVKNEPGFSLPLTLETIGTNPLISISYTKTENTQGAILLLATLKELDNGSIIISNKSKLMDLLEAFNEIPGIDSILTSNQ